MFKYYSEVTTMAFCNKCGNQLPDGANNCPNCGAPAGNTQQNTQNAQDFVNNMMNTNDTTSQFDPQDINNNKGLSVLAYIGFLFLVPLLACPNSKFARYHTNQGLVLFLLEFALGVVTGILGIIPIAGLIIGGLLSAVGGIFTLVLMIMGIINAAQGQAKELPLIGKITLLK
jgi:predicted membrane protein